MKIVLGTVLCVCALMAQPAAACLRTTVDERGVQWSTAIVVARLTQVEAPVQLAGSVKERRGNLGILGTAETVYFARIYRFTVERTLDGSAKPGELISVLRVTNRTEEPQLNCGQHLTEKSVNQSFLLLLRPFSAFTQALPDVITPPKDPTLQCVIHLEEMGSLKPDELKTIENTISSTRLGESQFNQKTADRLLTKIANSIDAQGAPTVRAFEKFGLRGLPALDAAIGREQSGSLSHSRLSRMKSEIAPPTTLVTMVTPEPIEGADAKGRRR